MKIKEAKANIILDSRGNETIEIIVNQTGKTSAPSGKSTGKHEKKPYKKDLKSDADFINKLNVKNLPEIKNFDDLKNLEEKIAKKIGANTLFAFEASVLKALAIDNGTELWKLLNPNASVFPRIISNTIGGGAHSSSAKIKPDFQEFLVACNKNPAVAEIINKKCHERAGNILENIRAAPPKKNDENAWITDLDNEKVLEVMKNVQENVFEESNMHIDIGLDCAASQFYDKKTKKYEYKDRIASRDRKEQIDYISEIAERFNLFYIEDPLDEDDFEGFAELAKKTKCLIVGDDLTTTNLKRAEKAVKMESVTGMIIKPNQIGSLIEVKKVIDLCAKNVVKTIMSHRSGETKDNTIADLAFAWQCDFIKIPAVGEERLSKVRRLQEIERSLKKPNSEEELKFRR